jgi:hypothetical protein
VWDYELHGGERIALLGEVAREQTSFRLAVNNGDEWVIS